METELADFKEKANEYYSKLTEKAPQKGISSNDYIRFRQGVEWAFNRLSADIRYAEAEGKRLSEVATHWQTEYDKLKADNELLLSNLKRIIDRIEENELKDAFPSAYQRAKEAIKQVENK